MSLPVTLLLGPSRHGVVRYARELAEAGGLPTDSPEEGARVHVHVTDRALADSPAEAAGRIESLATLHPLTVTLHDVPQASDGPRNLHRRGEAYRRIIAAAQAVAVSSAHEAGLVAEHLGTPAKVIPLGVRRALSPPLPPVRPSDEMLLAGYVYPGKGHEEAIRAAAPGTEVTALGGVSDGHTDEAERLERLALSLGVRFTVTGFLSDDAYERRLRGPGIPVVAHQHLSASRSLLDWLEQGRRPLVLASAYTRETAALRPGTLTLYNALPEALAAARRDPQTTVLAPGTPLGPTLADAAEYYRRWWTEEVPW